MVKSGSGGYNVTWTGVSGASKYTIRRNAKVIATVSGSARSFHVADKFTTEVLEAIPSFDVAAVSSKGVAGSRRQAPRACPPAVFLSTRGSGQNSGSAYGYGLGDKGRTVWDDARRRLGFSYSGFPAVANYYQAAGAGDLFVDKTIYRTSLGSGVSVATTQASIVAQQCPSTRIVMFGHSQGAQAVGTAYQSGVSSTVRSKVFRVVLFADAAHRNDKNIAQYPILMKNTRVGIKGARASFPAGTGTKVQSWCWGRDVVCSNPSWAITGPVSVGAIAGKCVAGWCFHGNAYETYARYGAFNLARDLNSVGARGVSAVNLTRPTATLAIAD